ncbi:hypothetical protein [Ramlibacter sp.]|uniref:hypothetical protein n=1 Tax=Ramlibacter sp. TaxID=1917967 RepID=UPI002C0A9B70|nr:hypothetical protein [Ramlibacter sp.]HWI82620.1 hypothetical protein [Ramlibacter sp.]
MLLLKLLLVPTLIALITLAGRRWGPAVAGWLSGFPVVAGPLLLMVGLEQGPAFAAQAAQASLLGILANLSFSIGYSWGARRFPWYLCLGCGMLGFGVAGALLMAVPMALWTALAVTVAGLLVAPRAFPRSAPFVLPLAQPSPLELPARMAAGAVLSVAVTMSAQRLGPAFSGLFSVFPVMALVFGVFSHLTWGAAGAIRLLSGMVRGFYAFATFCLLVALAVPGAGLALGFLAALGGALLVQAASFKRA